MVSVDGYNEVGLIKPLDSRFRFILVLVALNSNN